MPVRATGPGAGTGFPGPGPVPVPFPACLDMYDVEFGIIHFLLSPVTKTKGKNELLLLTLIQTRPRAVPAPPSARYSCMPMRAISFMQRSSRGPACLSGCSSKQLWRLTCARRSPHSCGECAGHFSLLRRSRPSSRPAVAEKVFGQHSSVRWSCDANK